MTSEELIKDKELHDFLIRRQTDLAFYQLLKTIFQHNNEIMKNKDDE